MMVFDAMDLQASHIIYSKLDQHNRPKEREDRRRGGGTRGPFIAGNLLVTGVERQTDLALDHGIHEQPHYRQHGLEHRSSIHAACCVLAVRLANTCKL